MKHKYGTPGVDHTSKEKRMSKSSIYRDGAQFKNSKSKALKNAKSKKIVESIKRNLVDIPDYEDKNNYEPND